RFIFDHHAKSRLNQLRERLERGDFDDLCPSAAGATGVTLTTVHRAKGCEWPVVFLPGLTEGAVPLRRSAMDLVAPLLLRDLSVPANGADLAAEVAARHLDEERRIFYVAASRARATLYLSYSRIDADGTSALLPSRLLDAVRACPVVEMESEGEEELPLHPLGALAHYRSLLRHPDPLLRAQALYAVDRLRQAYPEAVRPAEWWENIAETAGAAPPFPDGRLYLSASRLGAYRECPLAYQFAQHWRLREPSGPAATVGSLLHSVLEEYHRPGNALARGRETLQLLLEERFQESEFPYRPVAKQAKRNLEKLLDAYYGRYGSDGPVLAVERRFSFAFGPHVVNGFIDRVDKLPTGELEIVDYKSGTAMKYDDATADLQLALYDLAFYEDSELGALGRPAKVSYLYPKAIGKTAKADGKRSYQPTDQTRAYLKERVEYYARAMLAERFPSP
ncbi:MAG: PD-(D/E)XK nuclease family protein, partial [Chloroflexi bacterium]|nr:PD-(D/E)XK nuclease family protein [Chloroflexota bacterium]